MREGSILSGLPHQFNDFSAEPEPDKLLKQIITEKNTFI